MSTKSQLLEKKKKLTLGKAIRRISPFVIATGMTHLIGTVCVPENLRGFGKYDILYTESCTYYDFFGNIFTTKVSERLNVDIPHTSSFTYYYNIDPETRVCDFAEFRVDDIENFNIKELPNDIDVLKKIYGMPMDVAHEFKIFKTMLVSNELFDARIYTMDEGQIIPLSEKRKRDMLIAQLGAYAVGNMTFGLVGYKLMLDYEEQKQEKLTKQKNKELNIN